MFCSKCGTQLPENSTFCSACGSPVGQNSPSSSFMNDRSNEFTAEERGQNKVFAILSYFGILFLIPVFAGKKSNYMKFHINQGLVLFILGWLVDFTVGIFDQIIFMIFRYSGVYQVPNVLSGIFSFLLYSVLIAYTVLGVINAAKGQAKELPLIGKIHIAE